MAILRSWPKNVRACVCAYVQAASCVTFWTVRGATVRHTPTLHGALANTAQSASAYHSTSAASSSPHCLAISVCYFNPDGPTAAPFPSLIVVATYVNDQCQHNLSLGRYESAEGTGFLAYILELSIVSRASSLSFSHLLLFFYRHIFSN